MKRWEIEQLNTTQDHNGASMQCRRAGMVSNYLQILLVNSWICHPYSDQSNPTQRMEDERITFGQRTGAVIYPSAFD